MEHDFYKKRLEEKHSIEVIVPEKADRDLVSEVVYKELCCGILSEKSKAEYLRVITNLVKQGAQGVALACTEIPLLVKDGEAEVPLYETTYLHAMAAVDEALSDE
jgi:aspartate racemase